MKWSAESYRRDTLVDIMRTHARQGEDVKFRKVRGMRDGIFYEMYNGDKWVKKKLDNKEVDRIIMELYG